MSYTCHCRHPPLEGPQCPLCLCLCVFSMQSRRSPHLVLVLLRFYSLHLLHPALSVVIWCIIDLCSSFLTFKALGGGTQGAIPRTAVLTQRVDLAQTCHKWAILTSQPLAISHSALLPTAMRRHWLAPAGRTPHLLWAQYPPVLGSTSSAPQDPAIKNGSKHGTSWAKLLDIFRNWAVFASAGARAGDGKPY